MNTHFLIEQGDVHIWKTFLPSLREDIPNFLNILTPDEIERANRFRLEKHRENFVIARGVLRQLISLYINISPEKIVFSYEPQGKPYIDHSSLQFNLSHSEEMALYALTFNKYIGIDIEKMKSSFQLDIANRFFSADEYQYLLNMPENMKIKTFYSIWARKEALTKAIGKGLYSSFNQFSCLSLSNEIILKDGNFEHSFHIENLTIHSDYEAALAVSVPNKNIHMREWKR